MPCWRPAGSRSASRKAQPRAFGKLKCPAQKSAQGDRLQNGQNVENWLVLRQAMAEQIVQAVHINTPRQAITPMVDLSGGAVNPPLHTLFSLSI